MSKEKELLKRVLTSELWSVQEELQSEIRGLLAEPEQEKQQPVATKLESHQFTAFHVSSGDFKELQKLPVGTKLYSEPSMTGREMYQRGYARAEQHLKREHLSEGELNSLYYQATSQTLREQDTRLAFGFARAIEKAHGIGIVE